MTNSDAISIAWPIEGGATEIQRSLCESLSVDFIRIINSFVSRTDALRYALGNVAHQGRNYLVTVSKSHAGGKLIVEFVPAYIDSASVENEKLKFFENILK